MSKCRHGNPQAPKTPAVTLTDKEVRYVIENGSLSRAAVSRVRGIVACSLGSFEPCRFCRECSEDETRSGLEVGKSFGFRVDSAGEATCIAPRKFLGFRHEFLDGRNPSPIFTPTDPFFTAARRCAESPRHPESGRCRPVFS